MKWNYKRIPRRCIEKRKFWIFFETNWNDLIHWTKGYLYQTLRSSFVRFEYVRWIDNYAIENFFHETIKHNESYMKDIVKFNRKKYLLVKKTLWGLISFQIGVEKYVQINSISLNRFKLLYTPIIHFFFDHQFPISKDLFHSVSQWYKIK